MLESRCLRSREPGGRLRRAVRAAFVVGVVFAAAAPARGQLIITPTFDSSITGNANSAALQSAINTAIGVYQSLYTDNVNISILFRYSTTQPNGNPLGGGTLAQSNYTLYSPTYNQYTTALAADAPKSANDVIALANLPLASAFPNNPTNIPVSSANGRALPLGFGTPGAMSSNGNVGTGGTFDGIVTINSAQNFSLTRPVGNVGKFDVLQSIEHEIDEVMGLGSILPGTLDFSGNPAVRPQDLFRYSAANTISLTSSGAATSYFSINKGVTSIVAFNQNSTGDYGDWGTNPTPLVQLAFSNPNTQSDVTAGSPEGINLDVIGYNLNPVPEPSSLALVGLGTLIASGRVWRKRRRPVADQATGSA
jgi:hypothetical protein